MTTDVEAALVSSLGTVLNLPDVDAETSLFSAGGTSLHAEIFAHAASQATGQSITFTDVFQYPTPAGLARALAERGAPSAPASAERPRREPTDWHPVSENQAARLERLRVAEKTDIRLFRSDIEIVAAGLDLTGLVDVAALSAAVAEVVTNNTALRTLFDLHDGEFRQRVSPEVFELELLDAAYLHPTEVGDAVWVPFDLGSGKLARFVLASFAEDRHQLWIVLEHIVSDAVSCDRVVAQLAAAYSRRVLGGAEPDTASNGDIDGFEFAYLEATLCEDERGRAAEAHWLTQIGDGPVWRRFGHPEIAPAVDDPQADDVLQLRIADRDAGRRISERAAALGTTLHALVVFSLTRAAARVTGDRDVTVYWYTANRNLPGVETTVGSIAGITMARIAETPSGRSDDEVRLVTQAVADSMAYAFYPIDRIARVHRPDDWIMPDDRPLLVLHVNPEPVALPEGTQPAASRFEFAGLQVATAPSTGRRDRRGYTVDASTRFSDEGFLVGISYRQEMLRASVARELLDAFADELLAFAEVPAMAGEVSA